MSGVAEIASKRVLIMRAIGAARISAIATRTTATRRSRNASAL